MDETFDLCVEREIDAAPEDVYDAFVALYDRERPEWVTESDLDLRVGGRWHVRFHPAPDPPFREERTLTDVHRGSSSATTRGSRTTTVTSGSLPRYW